MKNSGTHYSLLALLFSCASPAQNTTYSGTTVRTTHTEQSTTNNTTQGTPTETTTNPSTSGTGAVITTTPIAPVSPTTTGAPTPTPALATTRFPLGSIRLLPTAEARGEDARTELEMHDDGQLFSHGRNVGRLVGERVLDANGRTLAEVNPNGAVVLGGAVTRLRITEEGTVQLPSGGTLYFSEDGTPTVRSPSGQEVRGPLQVVGLRPELRRTVALLAVLAGSIAR